jgi:hypothetical protein
VLLLCHSLTRSCLLQGIVTGLFVGNFVVDRMQVLSYAKSIETLTMALFDRSSWHNI